MKSRAPPKKLSVQKQDLRDAHGQMLVIWSKGALLEHSPVFIQFGLIITKVIILISIT